MLRAFNKFLSVMLLLCVIISIIPANVLAGPVTSRPSTLYLKPNSNWLEADARFAAYYFSDNSNGVWESMSDPDGDGIYEVPVPTTFDYVIFCRMNPTASVNSWDGKWNQTADLTIPLDGNNLYTVEDGTWDNGNGTWSTLGSSGDTSTDTETTTVDYYLVGYINGVDYGCDDDYQNLGIYKFVDNRLTATFVTDSYVFLKTSDNAKWFMAESYCTDTTCTMKLGGTEKLFVPGGVEVNFSLIINDESNVVISYYTISTECNHSYSSKITTQPTCTTEGIRTSTCSICNDVYTETIVATGHDYHLGTCSVCGEADPDYTETIYYLSGIGGIVYNPYDNPFVDGKITLDVPVTSYVYVIDNKGAAYKTDGWQGEADSVILKDERNVSGPPDKLMIPAGSVTLTLVDNGDDTFTLSYEMASVPDVSTNYYLVGYINGSNYGCDEDWENLGRYKFVDGSLTATFQQDSYVFIKTGDNAKWYMLPVYDDDGSASFYLTSTGASEKMFVPGGAEVIFNLTENSDGSLLVTYVLNENCDHACHGVDGFCTSCGKNTGHNFAMSVCTICGLSCTHVNIDNGVCATCGYQLAGDFYLFGYINGANYGCEEDAATWGSYKFVDGKLTASFTQDSYIAVKDSSNSNWFMFNSYCTETSGTLYNTNLGSSEKMFVPGGVTVNFTLVENADGTLTLSYTTGSGSVTVPTVTLNYPSLSFEDEILYNVYYGIDDTSSVVEMGLVTFSSKLTNGTIANAVDVIPGYVSDGTTYMAQTNGIPAKNLGDALYFKVYAKLADGSYVYSDVAGYNAVAYAKTVLGNSTTTTEAKALMVAMLNYGAAAQTYFDYNTGSLMNSFLTDAGKALVKDYDPSKVADVVKADSGKVGSFVMNGGYSNIYPTVSFEGAFAINFYFTPNKTVSGAPTMYYWDAATYNSASKLTAQNATGVLTMVNDGNGNWGAAVEGIAAKDMDSTIYVAGIYTSNGVSYPTNVIAYSLGNYCKTVAANGEAFGAATAVYGYYAKGYFN